MWIGGDKKKGGKGSKAFGCNGNNAELSLSNCCIVLNSKRSLIYKKYMYYCSNKFHKELNKISTILIVNHKILSCIYGKSLNYCSLDS